MKGYGPTNDEDDGSEEIYRIGEANQSNPSGPARCSRLSQLAPAAW
jgi:hypothetical protein